jgi:hypothetical protein
LVSICGDLVSEVFQVPHQKMAFFRGAGEAMEAESFQDSPQMLQVLLE